MATLMAMKASKQYSVADARDQLAAIVHRVERGTPVEITRRGTPVAVMLSVDEYRRLTAPRVDLVESLARFRATADLEALDLDGALRDVRDRSPGRSAPW